MILVNLVNCQFLLLRFLIAAIVQEVASCSIHTKTISKKGETLFSFIFRVLVLILSQFVNAMGKLALTSIPAAPKTNKITTQLVFELDILLFYNTS